MQLLLYRTQRTPSVLVLGQGHTAVTVGTDMIVFGGIVNGQRVDEVINNLLLTVPVTGCL